MSEIRMRAARSRHAASGARHTEIAVWLLKVLVPLLRWVEDAMSRSRLGRAVAQSVRIARPVARRARGQRKVSFARRSRATNAAT
jgi:hypothetical protein